MEQRNQELALLMQKAEQLEQRIKDLEEEMKEMNKRVANHDTSIAKIELIVENLQSQWATLEQHIRKVIETNTKVMEQSRSIPQKTGESEDHKAWREVAVETVRIISIIVGVVGSLYLIN